MDLESLLRANLDPTNPAGRALHEYRVNVTEVAGMLVARIHPEGFNAAEQIFALTSSGAFLAATEEQLEELRVRDAAAKIEADRARDLTHQAELERERDEESKRLAKQRTEELAAAEASRPADISKGTVEP